MLIKMVWHKGHLVPEVILLLFNLDKPWCIIAISYNLEKTSLKTVMLQSMYQGSFLLFHVNHRTSGLGHL